MLSLARGHFRSRPWSFVSTASPESKQREPFGTYPSKERGFTFLSSVLPYVAMILNFVFNQSNGIKRQMKESEKMPSNLVSLSGVSQRNEFPPFFLIISAWQSRMVTMPKWLSH